MMEEMSDKHTPIPNPPSLVNHKCPYCPMKNAQLRARPSLKFHPTNLQQQLLLDIGYRTYGRQVNGKIPLSPLLIDKIKSVHDELDRWIRDISQLGLMTTCSNGLPIHEPKQIYCFYDQVHWETNGRMKIDRRATAEMILECLRSYDGPDQINGFLLAVMHCQETQMRYFWPGTGRGFRIRNANGSVWARFMPVAHNVVVGRNLAPVLAQMYNIDIPDLHLFAPNSVLIPKNPVLSYWILNLGYRHLLPTDFLTAALISMNDYTSLRPLPDDEWLHALEFMWSEITEKQGGIDTDDMHGWCWEALVSSIKNKCFRVASFVWHQVPVAKRFITRSSNGYSLWKAVVEHGHYEIFMEMWNSIDDEYRDIALEEAFLSFHRAVRNGNHQIVDILWNAMSDLLRNTLLNKHPDIFAAAVEAKCFQLALTFWNAVDADHRTRLLDNHMTAFCTAAEMGHLETITVLWEHATEFQRFRLVFEDSCASFRKSCENGHLGVVRLLWEWASPDQRRHMLAQRHGEALSSAVRNGRIRVVEFLWRNMDASAILEAAEGSYVDEEALSSFICNASLGLNPAPADMELDIENVLRDFFAPPDQNRKPFMPLTVKSVLLNALLWNKEAALKCLLARAKETNRWNGLGDLLFSFDTKQRALLCAKMTSDQIEQCGLLEADPGKTTLEESGEMPEEKVEAIGLMEEENEEEEDYMGYYDGENMD